MESQTLEGMLKLKSFMHLDLARTRDSDDDGIRVGGEGIAVIGSSRVIYSWLTDFRGNLVSIVVPGVLVKVRYRTDSYGNMYSLVRPVDDDLKPELEQLVWSKFLVQYGIVLPNDFKFYYWTPHLFADLNAA